MRIGGAEHLRALAANIDTAVRGIGERWVMKFDMAGGPRSAPPTLLPRKTAPGTQPTNATVALRLADKGYDLFELTDAVKAEWTAHLAARFSGRQIPTPYQMLFALAPLYKALVVRRAGSGGGDLRLGPNASKTTARKAALGLSTLPAKATGQLEEALAASRVVVTKE